MGPVVRFVEIHEDEYGTYIGSCSVYFRADRSCIIMTCWNYNIKGTYPITLTLKYIHYEVLDIKNQKFCFNQLSASI